MNNLTNSTPIFANGSPNGSNSLLQYIQSLAPEVASQLSNPDPEVRQIMEHNLAGILGTLPAEQFGITITTNREYLGRLLASAMVTGYFLRNAQQRMKLEQTLP